MDVGTRMNNLTKNSIIYPNPCTNGFTINAGISTLKIYDLNGKLILLKQIKSKTYIDLSFLKAGVYIVKINGKNYKLLKN